MKVDICNTDKKYNLITADPPWKYGSGGPRGGRFGQLDYQTMKTKDICALPVADLADDNCALLMWFTASFVKDAIQVCEAWGFKVVRIDMVWEKLKKSGKKHAVVGPWGMSDAEFVLLGTKGKACSMQQVRNQYMVQKAEYTGKHSEKPEEILELFDARFGDVPRIELFAREHRDGWDCWGNEVEDLPAKKVVAWWSAGVTSAVACKMALEQYGKENVDLIYFGIESAHQDNARFKADCEKWYGKEIEVIRGKYDDQFDVIEDTRFINGPNGARCTMELKKNLRFQMQREREYHGQVFGFEYQRKEINRALRFMDQYPDTNPIFPLIKSKLTKPMCLQVLIDAGIEVPAMYKLGYPNNNCIGCVKGGIGYWNKIRADFPDTFERMSELEREIGRSCLKEQVWNGEVDEEGKKIMETKRLFLDELEPSRGKDMEIIMPDCGSLCDIKHVEIDHPRLNELMND